MLLIPGMRVFLNKTNTKSRKILTINIEGLYSMKWEWGEGGGGVRCESVWGGKEAIGVD